MAHELRMLDGERRLAATEWARGVAGAGRTPEPAAARMREERLAVDRDLQREQGDADDDRQDSAAHRHAAARDRGASGRDRFSAAQDRLRARTDREIAFARLTRTRIRFGRSQRREDGA
ncbi:hypothetical protein [Nonomuraea sp. NPDC050783]|uniref:hypothetical protein n=1 Tax=Nonomuraea sp. NPDC050783 TaxID=3154634 RepID=UPI003467A483